MQEPAEMGDFKADWAEGLPPDVLALVAKAGGVPDMKAMRGVNKTWQHGFELGISGIKVPCNSSWLRGDDVAGPRLAALDLAGINFWHGDDRLKNLRSLPYLQSLKLRSSSWLTDAGLKHLGGLPLTHLNLSRCPNITYAQLYNLRKSPLTHLDLRGNAWVSESSLQKLKGLRLASLYLSWCPNITVASLKYLRGMPMTSLKLFSCGEIVSDAGLEMLRGLPLTSLTLGYLDHTNVTSAGFDALSGMPLTSLRLLGSGKVVTRAAFEKLRGLPLKDLDLICYSIATDDGVEALASLPLKRLRIMNNFSRFTNACRNEPKLAGVVEFHDRIPADSVSDL